MRLPSLVLLPFLAASAASAQDPGTSYLYLVEDPNPGQRVRLLQHFDVLGACCGQTLSGDDLRVVVQPGREHRAFQRVAPDAELIERGRPFQEVYNAMLAAAPEAPPDPAYYTVAEVEQEIDAMVAQYPNLARKVDLTTLPGAAVTHNNRSIYALEVSDNVTAQEDERAVVVAAQHHARELNAPHMVIGAMQRVLQGYATDPQLQALVDDSELWFVPMCNPDGVAHVWNVDRWWRKNRRNNGSDYGVDLNRNFPFLWGVCGASSFTWSNTYKGPSAGSEPETRTMRALIAAVRPEIYLDFHSYGQEVLTLYPPCASVSSSVATLDNHYLNDLAAPMSYVTRQPSASGEAPQDHWAASGALSYLIEVGSSFQPSFSATVTEEARVWPGIRHALTAWKPAFRGHVTSVFQSQPLEATITVSPNPYSHGEVTMSRARDGRYGLWLPQGTWTVTWSATGYQPVSRTVTVNGYDQGTLLDVELEPQWSQATITSTGSAGIGTNLAVTYTSPGDAGDGYLIGWSTGTTPGIAIGSRTLPLNDDFLFQAALAGNNVMINNQGTLDGSAQGVATVQIPNLSALVGFTVHFAGVTLAPGYTMGVKKFSQPITVTVQP